MIAMKFLNTKERQYMCSICGKRLREVDDRHNAQPVALGHACDYCNLNVVIPTRIVNIQMSNA